MYIPLPNIQQLEQETINDQKAIDSITNNLKPALPPEKPLKRRSKLTGRILKWDKSKGGRPTVMTDITLKKLESGASLNFNVSEMCLHAGITAQTYYEYIKKVPQFAERIDLLRHNVSIRAKRVINDVISSGDDVKLATDTAKWHLEKTEQEYQPIQRNLNVNQNLQDDNKPITDVIKDLLNKYPIE